MFEHLKNSEIQKEMNTVWIVFLILSLVEIKAQINRGSSVHFGERNINNNGDDDDSFLLPRVCAPADTSFLPTFDVVFRILGGRQVSPGEMPWMLRMDIYSTGSNRPSQCGGFLINRKWAMTAAHCLEQANNVTMSAGRTDDSSLDSPPEVTMTMFRSNFFIHPRYSSDHKKHDIALIELPSSLRHARSVRPICLLDNNLCQQLPQLRSNDENNCGMVFAAGWGTTETEVSSKVLRKINMTVVGQRFCDRAFTNETIGPTQMCAIGQQFQSLYGPIYEDTCRGDSGGPLMCQVDGSMVALGIVSFGRGCGRSTPGVYTRICSYKRWMMHTMNISGCQVPRIDHATFLKAGSPIETGSTVPINTSITLVCESNFHPNVTANSAVTSTCKNVDQWSPALAGCVPSNSECQNLPDISNGHILVTSAVISSVAIISCDDGFQLQGNNWLRCLSNGQWSAPNGRCVAAPSISCGPTPSIANGSVADDGTITVGSSRPIICLPNYRLVGNDRIFCQQDGVWSQPGQCLPGKE